MSFPYEILGEEEKPAKTRLLDMSLTSEAAGYLCALADGFWGEWTPNYDQCILEEPWLVDAVEAIAFKLRKRVQEERKK